MKLKYPNLFSPIKIRGYIFKNRIMSAPLGAWVFSPDNFIFDYAISMFEEKARGGAAVVTVGHTEINYRDDDSDGFGLYFDLRKREGTAALTEFASAIQQYGSHASIELNYGGISHYVPKESDFSDTFDPDAYPPPPKDGLLSAQKEVYGVCGFNSPFGYMPQMPVEKMKSIIADFVLCVNKMKRCGYHMVTIHGAHGWLPAQFLSPHTNRRKDEYGGSLENRMRFPLELVRAVREAAGDDMVVEYRLSGIDPTEDSAGFEELVTFCNALDGLADIIHVSAGGTGRDTFNRTFPSHLDPRGVNRALAEPLKKRISLPVAVVGSISQPEMAEAFIKEGVADFVAMCRTLIADPEWPNKVRRGQEEDVIPCIACYNCLDEMHKSHFLGCNVNPRSGREHRVSPITPAPERKKVAVIGGGPAGMQAAITAADRCHNVTLYEKSGKLGGLLRIAEDNQVKWMLEKYRQYLIRQVGKRGISVKLDTVATRELMEQLMPDAIIVASGSVPIVPDIPGADADNVFTCVTAHERTDELGDNIVIVGGNLAGCETALYLRSIGKENVTIVEMTDRLYADCGELVGYSMKLYMGNSGIKSMTGTRCVKIGKEGITVRTAEGAESVLPCDTVILAVGMEPQYRVFEEMLGCAPDVIPVGDCIKPGNVMNTSRNGYFAARTL